MNKRNSKISEQTKEQIYKDYLKTGCELKKLAYRYSISDSTVSAIITEHLNNRKHITNKSKESKI